MARRLIAAACISLALLGISCVGCTDPNGATSETNLPDSGVPKTTRLDGATGRITGSVVFTEKNLPAPTVVMNDKDVPACGAKITKQDLLISQEGRGIANVVLRLVDVKLPEDYKPPHQDLRVAAQRCQFRPHVAAMTIGSAIKLQNVDLIGHTTNMTGVHIEKVPLPANAAEFNTEARELGLFEIHCDEHDWMQAFVWVDAHPFHAVTDSEGQFTIEAVPVGTYKMNVWHEKFKEQEVEVVVSTAKATQVELGFPPKKKEPPKRK